MPADTQSDSLVIEPQHALQGGRMSRIAMHEDLSRHAEIRGSSDRNFGFVFTIFFLVLGLWPLRKGQSARLWALMASGLFLLAALAMPWVLTPLNRAWMKLGLLMARVVNPVVTAVMFYGMFTPMGLILRLLGKDTLRLRFDAGAPSYWIERKPPGPDPESMSNQF